MSNHDNSMSPIQIPVRRTKKAAAKPRRPREWPGYGKFTTKRGRGELRQVALHPFGFDPAYIRPVRIVEIVKEKRRARKAKRAAAEKVTG